MDAFTFTAWNIEHCDKLLSALDSTSPRTRAHADARADAITEEIAALDADILLISEGPHGPDRARAFFARVAPDHDLITRPGDDPDDYGMKGGSGFAGRQWLWFLVRRGTPIRAQLQHLDRWDALARIGAGRDYRSASGRWDVSYPEFRPGQGSTPDRLAFSIDETHAHWRHPQVLQVDIAGAFVEIIGCHLKSKYTRAPVTGDADDRDFFDQNPELVAELIKARTKISTECADIRNYIEGRFAEAAHAAIIVAGDLNDGPGKERIERRFLYHDLLGGLQGDVFFARRFLNHALFDAEDGERWSVHFEDALDSRRDPHILLDHILFSQSMTGSFTGTPCPYRAPGGGGRVEHDIHHRVNSSRFKYARTSDHKPISMRFVKRDQG